MILLFIMTQIEKKGYYMSVSKVKTKITKQKITNPVANVLVHIYAYVLFVIYVLPVILIVLFSFTSSKNIATRTLDFSSFSLENYRYLLQNASNYKPWSMGAALRTTPHQRSRKDKRSCTDKSVLRRSISP